MKKQNGNHVRKKWAPVLAVGILLLAGAMIVFPCLNPFLILNSLTLNIVALEKSDADNITILNNYMTDRYSHVIYPEGKERISAELEKIRQISDPDARLDAIFVWEMKDWIRPNDNLSAFICPNTACTYAYLESDHYRMKASPYYDGILYPQRNQEGTMYADDPYWIAYNMVGECREYSALFAFMAQQSGIDARLVRTYSYSHQWVEVELANGSYYYDPWCADNYGYYNATDGNMTFRDKWFNKIGVYEENCPTPGPYPLLMSYDGPPYLWATPKYLAVSGWHALGTAFNVSLPG
ncbi:MAG: transglutaminase domain-containing protein [Methanoregula sp.]|jgi:hypothetical protein|uniref:transglutaminase domain-containing protein n=1 Tax=Methanoregula sp. TaxID=2052170 RepID=UPI003C17CF71